MARKLEVYGEARRVAALELMSVRFETPHKSVRKTYELLSRMTAQRSREASEANFEFDAYLLDDISRAALRLA